MKNLGKIILVLLTPIYVFASVVASVDANHITKGEEVTLSLSISGEDIKKPILSDICGFDILESSSQTNIMMVNGNYEKKYSLNYKFIPLKSCNIEPIEIEIDSKVEKTKPINIKVSEQIVDKNSDFVLSLVTKKKDIFVGESFQVDLIFKQRDGASAIDSKFEAPKFKGFWVKNQSKQTSYKDGDFNIIKISYTLSAQREGKLSITPAKIGIANRVNDRDNWGGFMQSVKWKTYFSNTLEIDAKPLPNGVSYIGDFQIEVDVEKTTIDKNEAFNLTLKITGDGNLEDMKSFKPQIDGVTIYDEKIAIKDNQLTQKMAFISDNNFVIKPFSLKYFDIKTNKVKTISTKEIKVDVKGVDKKEELIIKKSQPIKQQPTKQVVVSNGISTIYAFVIFVFGLVVGILIMFFKPWLLYETDAKVDIKDEKLLFIKLLPFKDDDSVQQLLDVLERNIYTDKKEKLDKKMLKDILVKYKII